MLVCAQMQKNHVCIIIYRVFTGSLIQDIVPSCSPLVAAGHALAKRLHILRPLGSKDLTSQGLGTLRPGFGGTLDVEGQTLHYTRSPKF